MEEMEIGLEMAKQSFRNDFLNTTYMFIFNQHLTFRYNAPSNHSILDVGCEPIERIGQNGLTEIGIRISFAGEDEPEHEDIILVTQNPENKGFEPADELLETFAEIKKGIDPMDRDEMLRTIAGSTAKDQIERMHSMWVNKSIQIFSLFGDDITHNPETGVLEVIDKTPQTVATSGDYL